MVAVGYCDRLMARILLIDSDETHALALTSDLKLGRHSVTITPRMDRVLREEILTQFDAVIIDLTRNQQEEWRTLEWLCRQRMTQHTRTAVLCLSRVYRGPGMKLKIERMGARLIYER